MGAVSGHGLARSCAGVPSWRLGPGNAACCRAISRLGKRKADGLPDRAHWDRCGLGRRLAMAAAAIPRAKAAAKSPKAMDKMLA